MAVGPQYAKARAPSSQLIAAKKIQAAIVQPTAIFIAVATALPTTAPVAAFVDAPAPEPTLSSPSSAPAKLPTNAPMSGPTIGTGKPMNAPTIPPSIAPQPERREPPYLRAYFPDNVNSMYSAMRAITVTATNVNQPIGALGTMML